MRAKNIPNFLSDEIIKRVRGGVKIDVLMAVRRVEIDLANRQAETTAPIWRIARTTLTATIINKLLSTSW